MPARSRPAARWLSPPNVEAADVRALQAALRLPERLCALLVARGFIDPDSAKRYLRPKLEHLHAPSLMLDMDIAVERIRKAISAGEKILVHGDYDVDGITSTALLTRVLRSLGGDVVPFVPHRSDGYDLTDAGVQAALDKRATLVVTCDCGTSAHGPVDRLRESGIDVIITDHHLPGGPLPSAVAVLNPRRPGCNYPDKDLAACGIVFKLALALVGAMNGDEEIVLDRLDLVALATIADVARLRGENRVLVRHGLRRCMSARALPGIQALVRSSGLEGKELTAGRIGFILAPRLNAAGRVGHAMRGVDLMLADESDEAFGIARELEQLNTRRRELDSTTLDKARSMLDQVDLDETFGLVIAGEGWHPGIIGIVASRIVEETGRPAVLIAVDKGIGKGSGRSISPFDLHSALTACRDCFVRFGGHRAAAGVTIDAGRIPEFAERFNSIARQRLTPDDLVPELRYDLELPLAAVTDELLKMMRHCEPHGIGNPAPIFVSSGVRTATAPKRIGENGIRTCLTSDDGVLEAIGWDFADRIADVDWRAPFDVAYRLERDEWKGRSRLQARLADVRQ